MERWKINIDTETNNSNVSEWSIITEISHLESDFLKEELHPCTAAYVENVALSLQRELCQIWYITSSDIKWVSISWSWRLQI